MKEIEENQRNDYLIRLELDTNKIMDQVLISLGPIGKFVVWFGQ